MTGLTDSKTILVTGATSGIGRATAIGLGTRGSTLVLLARDRLRGEEVAGVVRRAGAAYAEVLVCDLSLMSSVREAAAAFDNAERSAARALARSIAAAFAAAETR